MALKGRELGLAGKREVSDGKSFGLKVRKKKSRKKNEPLGDLIQGLDIFTGKWLSRRQRSLSSGCGL